jgi:small subunit ribosomal protein S1
MKDKSGIVLLPGGFEGICPEQHMNKVDGSKAQVDETLAFKVLEYKKESMKIIVSHTRTFEEEENRPSSTVKSSETAKKSIAPKKVAASSSDQIVNQIKTTFGAFDVLSELKNKMENDEENNGIDKQ